MADKGHIATSAEDLQEVRMQRVLRILADKAITARSAEEPRSASRADKSRNARSANEPRSATMAEEGVNARSAEF